MRIDSTLTGPIGAQVSAATKPIVAGFNEALDHAAGTAQKLSAIERRALSSLESLFGRSEKGVVFRQPSSDGELKIKAEDIPAKVVQDLGKLRDASEKLEALMVEKMLASMEKAMPKSESDGPMSNFARDMMRQTLGVEMARRNGTGLADSIYRQGAKAQLAIHAAKLKTAVTPEEKHEQNP